MLTFMQGNLLESDADALVNTVNTEGVMGKGVALMFKEAFPENYKAYVEACKSGDVQLGRMFVTEPNRLDGPKWIINFPTKKHWRNPSKIEWIEEGLQDLRQVVVDKRIRSVALPPLGSGNGGLDWTDVRPRIVAALECLPEVTVIVYEPTARYQNVAKRRGVEKLTPPRALVAELIRRYWILGIECSLLEIQKLAYFLECSIDAFELKNTLDLRFRADKFGPYSSRLMHLLNNLDGSYLHSDKRISDAGVLDVIRFEDAKREFLELYLRSAEAKPYQPALEATTRLIDGFESPLGMELLATVHWLVHRMAVEPTIPALRMGLTRWPGGSKVAERKQQLFNDRLIGLALGQIESVT
jgi:O-acetyl-ADP-ribose deacetylase (regulator of RNase III)